MSDYVRNKAVMYPITKEEYESFYSKYGYDNWPEHFDAEVMVDAFDENYYLSYVLCHTYGQESWDFGRARSLSVREQEKYAKLFEPVLQVDSSKLKYVDYCYYNGCDSEDYYKSSDDFYKEI